MTSYSFHHAVDHWFTRQFDKPTRAQALGWPAIQSGSHTLIAAPTGSGKTLAAFLASLDRLFKLALEGSLENQTKVLYVSPLKALSNDIHRNLSEPLSGIQASMAELGYGQPLVTAAVRTGDTSARERREIAKTPPHVLVTTPESFYLMLTSESGRETLKHVDTLIVDEIHALADNRRGAHLALSIERLEALVGGGLQRIGLSATQRPMERVAHFLVGGRHVRFDGSPDCAIIDEGHLKETELEVEVPGSPLEAVMSAEVWEEVYARLIALIESHRTTLIFVNTRRLAERIAYNLTNKLGEEHVAAHHGSLSLKIRQGAEKRLKEGHLKVLVATASLEMGIDIGYVDLVCQIGSPRSISALLQRVGRSGHHYGGIPKGRIFPLTRDELVESVALINSVRRGFLDKLILQQKPLDVLAQQIVAAAAQEEWDESALYALFKNAHVYKDLTRKEFDQVVTMLATGTDTKRGRRGALIFYDGVNRKIRGRKGSRLTALTCGGAIPDNADYRVVLEPEGTFVGTLNEDFAVESLPGDVFRLGTHSWRILKIESGLVRVEDAQGMPPNIPFWFGEAPARTIELSLAVSEFRAQVDERIGDQKRLRHYLTQELKLSTPCAEQLEVYFTAARKALGALPTQETIVMERFFDEAGNMHLVIHAPFGGRLNRAWGLALRKRFCRSFNFELQAAANEDAIVLSLGPSHSFPLEEVFSFLSPSTVKDVLIQAVLDAPLFQTRWRWNASRALVLRRRSGGKLVPPTIQRMQAEDLLAVVFPDQQACLENIAGDREVPDHPLVNQTLDDCLHEAMDLDGLILLLEKIRDKKIRRIALDLPEPSPIAHEILNANPYAFLDNAPLEERRTQAVYLRRTLSPESIREEGVLEPEAIAEVKRQVWPTAASDDEVHEALWLMGGLRTDHPQKPESLWRGALKRLAECGRAGIIAFEQGGETFELYTVVELLPRWKAAVPQASVTPENLEPPASFQEVQWTSEDGIRELVRGRLEVSGPVTAAILSDALGFTKEDVNIALAALEGEGAAFRGYFDPELPGEQWCDRAILARIHQLTIRTLRSRIKPVSIADYMRFLFSWQRVAPSKRAREINGLESVIELLEGYEAACGTWEEELLPLRMASYSEGWLDNLCLLGKVGWGRISPPNGGKRTGAGPLKTSPIALFLRENADIWTSALQPEELQPSTNAQIVLDVLRQRGALFFSQIQEASRLLYTQTETALGELVALGMVSADSFAGLRSLLLPANKKPSAKRRVATHRQPFNSREIAFAGRWWPLREPTQETTETNDTYGMDHESEVVAYRARVLLRRYGVVFRKLLEKENSTPPWRELLRVYRRMEAVGELRGGYFVAGVGGEQFALPEAVGLLRTTRENKEPLEFIAVNALDPLNLTGTLLPGPTISQVHGNRILFREGVPVAAIEAGRLVKWPNNEVSISDAELENRLRPKTRRGAMISTLRRRA